MNDIVKLGIYAAIIAGVFFWMWRAGYLARLRAYVLETREELRKCTWPTWDELRGSTIVVMISILLLGFFTVAVDRVLYSLVTAMIKI